MANSLVKNVRAEKRNSTNWSKMRRYSFQKIDLHFVHWNKGPNWPIFRDIQGRNILPVKIAIKGASTSNHHNHKRALPLMFSLIFLGKHKSSDEIEMASIVVEFCFYNSSFFFKNNYF